MGNKPVRNKIRRPYNDMVEDAIAALKDRPGSTQADVFNYLESKYEGRIPPRAKKNLETVIRSILKTKEGGNSGRSIRSAGRRVRFKPKRSLKRCKPGRLRSRGNARRLVPRSGNNCKKKRPLKSRSKSGGHRHLKRTRRGSSKRPKASP